MKAHRTLSTKVAEWSSLTNNYEELPQESIALLKVRSNDTISRDSSMDINMLTWLYLV